MTKEEIIKEVYGENFSNCNPDENGWTGQYVWRRKVSGAIDEDVVDYDRKNQIVRPKTLRGIENNNGWTEGAPEKDGGTYWIMAEDLAEPEIVVSVSCYDEFWSGTCCFKQKHITHHQPLQKPKPPIH